MYSKDKFGGFCGAHGQAAQVLDFTIREGGIEKYTGSRDY